MNPAPMTSDTGRVAGSFRDPSGRVFTRDGTLYRTVNHYYRDDYDRLMESGLYQKLTERGLLVRHDEVDAAEVIPADVTAAGEPAAADLYRLIRPKRIPFISYPYEWSFSQLKDAALLTLTVMGIALEHGMVLKDASAFNIQFVGCRPVLIDTLSFETYHEGAPWVGYRQFCQHFLAPLAIISYTDVRGGQLLRSNLDGIPLELAGRLIPKRTLAKPSLAMHLHAHARAQDRYADSGRSARTVSVSRRSLMGLIDSLTGATRKLTWQAGTTEWSDYYDDTNYSEAAMAAKEGLVGRFIDQAKPGSVWDLGANTGRFSRLASGLGAYTVAFDIDPAAVEKAYLDARERTDERLLPLVQDLMNPSPDLGWALMERQSLTGRGRPDLVLALALVHHLAIGQNVPLDYIAEFLAGLAPRLVIEFVPKADSQVQRLLASREDIFPDYDRAGFERAFDAHFAIEESAPVEGSERTLYLMTRK